MSKLLIQAPAKINLGLEILQKRRDGYHDIKTVFCQVSLYDVIEIREKGEKRIEIFCDDKMVPTDERNTVWKAVNLLGKTGLRINIKKQIPVKAGLGGGSSDAGAVLKALGRNDTERLKKLGLEIGADVPYAICGGTKLGEGRGERLSDLPSLTGINLVICVPDVGVETRWAYQSVDYSKIGKGKIEGLIKAIKKKNVFEIAKSLHNDFEYWVLPKYPEILKIKKDMIKYGALGVLMTGSGSGVFGICESETQAKIVFEKMKKKYKKSFLVKIL